MPINYDLERKLLAGGLLVLACSLGALASALAVLALDHMAMSASLCGPTTGHCISCFGAITCLAAALSTGGAGVSLVRSGSICGATA